MSTTTTQENTMSPIQDRILLLLCPEADTVTWCQTAEEFTRSIFPNVEAIYWAPGDPYPAELDAWEGEWIISFRGDLIVPERVYTKARKGALNCHPCPPHFRGLGGHIYAIYENHETFGSTFHHMAKSVDTGQIIDVKRFAIAPNETATSLRHHVGAVSLAQYFELVSEYIAKGVPLPTSTENWGEKLFTSKALAKWIEEKKAVEPDHRCFR
ncbi:formyltransferase family protein [Streptomyces chattanoogensis]|uniref:formyltransferase family protein n=1 Tax=Streptomyces chattanoogensis TaxID=66876 RepID=UPI0036943778